MQVMCMLYWKHLHHSRSLAKASQAVRQKHIAEHGMKNEALRLSYSSSLCSYLATFGTAFAHLRFFH
jgi:hypothetical protein